MELVDFKCINCGKDGTGFKNQKWCSGRSCKPKERLKHNGTCVKCSKPFRGAKLRKYCSKDCRDQQYFGLSRLKHLSTGTVGAIQELRVCVDLMSKGYEVFRALSPACSCDVLGLKDGKMYRFEVRTGYELDNGKIMASNRNFKADYLVIATHNKLTYEPEL